MLGDLEILVYSISPTCRNYSSAKVVHLWFLKETECYKKLRKHCRLWSERIFLVLTRDVGDDR